MLCYAVFSVDYVVVVCCMVSVIYVYVVIDRVVVVVCCVSFIFLCLCRCSLYCSHRYVRCWLCCCVCFGIVYTVIVIVNAVYVIVGVCWYSCVAVYVVIVVVVTVVGICYI